MKLFRTPALSGFKIALAAALLAQANGVLAEKPKPITTDEKARLENLEFRAAIGAHHLCSGLWVVGRDYQ